MEMKLIADKLINLFTDEKVSLDLEAALIRDFAFNERQVTFGNDEVLTIPSGLRHKVLTVTLQRDILVDCLEVRVFVALGGVKSERNGLINPNYCFAVVRYNEDGVLYTYDLYNTQFY